MLLDQFQNPVFGQIDLSGPNTEPAGHLLDRPPLHHVEIENLIRFGADLSLDAPEGGENNVLGPFLVPKSVEVTAVFGGDPLDGCRVGSPLGLVTGRGPVPSALAELVVDFPACGIEQPALK